MDAIAAVRLAKRYGPVRALADVTFSVCTGEVFGLLGPNGGFWQHCNLGLGYFFEART